METEEKSFEQCLWNKYQVLHKRYKRKCEYFENAIDIFTRVLNCFKYYQKEINTVLQKGYLLFPEPESTQSKALDIIKKGLEIEFSQLSLDVDLLKKVLVDQFKKHKDDARATEKEAHTQFQKILTKYADSKVLIDKNKNKYYQSLKVAESSLRTSKSMKIKNVNNSQDNLVSIKKLEDKSQDLLLDAKKNLDKYSAAVRDANKSREEAIDKQAKNLKLYNELEVKDGIFITKIVNDMYNRMKEENEAKKTYLTEIEGIIKQIDVDTDIKNIMKANNSNEKPDELISLEQYSPQIDFEKASNPEEYKINHEIIVAMKTIIPDIMPNFDMEKERKKQEMRELSKKIFVTNIPFTDEEKQKLMEYLQQKWSQTYFLIYLSKQRTQGRFSRSEKLVKDLAEILNLILKTAEEQNDYEAARNCMILSQTYFYEDKDENGNAKKVYLLEYILEYKWLRTPQFWRGLIEEMISQEIKKYTNMNPGEPSLLDETNEKSMERLSNIGFSQLLPYCNNMREFFMDDRIVVKIIDEFVEKYHIQKEFAQSIYDVINSNPEELEKLRQEYKNNPNIENEMMSLEEVKKQRGVA